MPDWSTLLHGLLVGGAIISSVVWFGWSLCLCATCEYNPWLLTDIHWRRRVLYYRHNRVMDRKPILNDGKKVSDRRNYRPAIAASR